MVRARHTIIWTSQDYLISNLNTIYYVCKLKHITTKTLILPFPNESVHSFASPVSFICIPARNPLSVFKIIMILIALKGASRDFYNLLTAPQTVSGGRNSSLVVFGLVVHSVAFPQKTLSDESINRGLVCAHMHFIARTMILTFMS